MKQRTTGFTLNSDALCDEHKSMNSDVAMLSQTQVIKFFFHNARLNIGIQQNNRSITKY